MHQEECPVTGIQNHSRGNQLIVANLPWKRWLRECEGLYKISCLHR